MTEQPLRLEGIDGFESFSFDDESGNRLLDPPEGPWRSWWGAMSGRVGSMQGQQSRYATVPSTDFPHIIVFRDELRSHVERILSPFGEILPVDSNVGRLWAFHCTNVVDALDLDRCEGVKWRDGEGGEPRRIRFYLHLAFHPDRVREGKVFVVPERPHGLVYFAPEVAEALMDPPEPFTGSTFRKPYGSKG